MARLAWCLLAIACLPLVLASLGVDVSIPVTQSQFQCMKGQGYSFAMYASSRLASSPSYHGTLVAVHSHELGSWS